MSKLAKKLKDKIPKSKKRQRPLWKGPEVDGVTQSMLSKFMVCRERFRLLVVEGLKPVDRFNHRIEYGQMWHKCEEHSYSEEGWRQALRDYCLKLVEKYPTESTQVDKWYNVCKTQFPIYTKHWQSYDKDNKRKRSLSEVVFCEKLELPGGKVVKIRGKWDGVSAFGTRKSAYDGMYTNVYMDEHKTKGDIKEEQLHTQLGFDLQTMIYLTAMHHAAFTKPTEYVAPNGVLYNVIRRPLSGGKGSIKQLKPTNKNPAGESETEFYARLGRDYIEDDPNYFFMRWKTEVSYKDIEKFCVEFLRPTLNQLCDWWDWVSSPEGLKNPFANPIHWRTPYGFYNVLAEGGSTEMDKYLANGSELGLTRNAKLFTELS